MTTTANIPDFNPAAMMSALPGRLLAFLLPTDCLRSLENWPPFHRAFRQYVGNPEAIYPLYDNVQQQPVGNYAFDFQPFYTDFLRRLVGWYLPNQSTTGKPVARKSCFSGIVPNNATL